MNDEEYGHQKQWGVATGVSLACRKTNMRAAEMRPRKNMMWAIGTWWSAASLIRAAMPANARLAPIIQNAATPLVRLTK
jgi:hypothetical protein